MTNVKVLSTLDHDAKRYNAGDELELPDGAVKSLLDAGVVEVLEVEQEKPVKKAKKVVETKGDETDEGDKYFAQMGKTALLDAAKELGVEVDQTLKAGQIAEILNKHVEDTKETDEE